MTSTGGFTGFPFGSVYNGTKWALEGWSECLSIELALFNVGVKTVSPDAAKTELFTRSSDKVSHPAYAEAMQKVLGGINPSSTPEQMAEVIYEAATDGKDQLRYPAGVTAAAIYNRRLEIGPEASRQEMAKWFLGA